MIKKNKEDILTNLTKFDPQEGSLTHPSPERVVVTFLMRIMRQGLRESIKGLVFKEWPADGDMKLKFYDPGKDEERKGHLLVQVNVNLATKDVATLMLSGKLNKNGDGYRWQVCRIRYVFDFNDAGFESIERRDFEIPAEWRKEIEWNIHSSSE